MLIQTSPRIPCLDQLDGQADDDSSSKYTEEDVEELLQSLPKLVERRHVELVAEGDGLLRRDW